MAHLHIVECAGKSLHVGRSIDLERRLAQHRAGEGADYTKRRLPVRLIFAEEFTRIDEAFAGEKQVQNWSRAKRVALIEGRLGDLYGLSRKPPRKSPLVE